MAAGLLRARDPGRVQIGVEIGFQFVVRRHFVPFATLFMKAHPPALAGREIVLDAHGDGSADAGEAVGHEAISARSRWPTTVETSMLSSSSRA